MSRSPTGSAYSVAHEYQYTRPILLAGSCTRLTISLYAAVSHFAMPESVVCSLCDDLILPFEAGRFSSVIQTGVRASWLLFITRRKRRAIVITPIGSFVYGCTAATSK